MRADSVWLRFTLMLVQSRTLASKKLFVPDCTEPGLGCQCQLQCAHQRLEGVERKHVTALRVFRQTETLSATGHRDGQRGDLYSDQRYQEGQQYQQPPAWASENPEVQALLGPLICSAMFSSAAHRQYVLCDVYNKVQLD